MQIHVANTKRGKTYASKLQMILIFTLTGKESCVRFFSQLQALCELKLLKIMVSLIRDLKQPQRKVLCLRNLVKRNEINDILLRTKGICT